MGELSRHTFRIIPGIGTCSLFLDVAPNASRSAGSSSQHRPWGDAGWRACISCPVTFFYIPHRKKSNETFKTLYSDCSIYCASEYSAFELFFDFSAVRQLRLWTVLHLIPQRVANIVIEDLSAFSLCRDFRFTKQLTSDLGNDALHLFKQRF